VTQPPAAHPGRPTDQQALLAQRYGTSRRSPLAMITLVVLGVLFVGWVVWAGVQQADQDVRWRTVGYSEPSTTQVTVEFDVFKPAGTDVVCLVRALDLDSAEVGRAEVPVTAEGTDANITYTLSVTARPNTAEVVSCRLDP
jgi:hypothetical protein